MSTPFHRIGKALAMAVLAVCIASADLPAEAARSGAPVAVVFEHPERFTDAAERHQADEATRNIHLEALARHLVERAAPRLRPGQRLEVVVTDIDRAGAYEPWRRGSYDLRIVRNVYSPRIDLRFRLEDEAGAVIKEGERRLRDPFVLAARDGTGDALRYEKALLDGWLERDFARP